MAKTKAELMAEKMAAKRVGEAAFETGKKPVAETEIPPVTEKVEEETAIPATEPAQFEAQDVKEGKDPSKKESAPEAVSEPSGEVEQNAVAFNLDDIGASARPEKKTYSVYLSTAVMSEVEKRAKKAKMKSSAYIDELLKRVLGL